MPYFQNLSLKELEKVTVQMHVVNQAAFKKNPRSSPADGQSSAGLKEGSSKEMLDDDSLEATIVQKMCPRCRICYKWLKWLPVDGKKHYKEVQRDQKTSTHNKRPHPTGPRQHSSLVAPPDTRMQSKGNRPLYETRPPHYYRVDNQLERKHRFSARHKTRTGN